MKVRQIMTRDPASCRRETPLQEVARLMRDHDCGAIPVYDGDKAVGIITDRDIVCRAIADGKNPLTLTAGDCMTTPVATVSLEMKIEEAGRIMAERQIRRVVVIDDEGSCCGILAQADLARQAPAKRTADVVREVSQPAHH